MSAFQQVSRAGAGLRGRLARGHAVGSVGGPLEASRLPQQRFGAAEDSFGDECARLEQSGERLRGTDAVDDQFMEVDNDTVHSQSQRAINSKSKDGHGQVDGSPLDVTEERVELGQSGRMGRDYFINVDEEVGSAHPVGRSQLAGRAEGRRRQDGGAYSAILKHMNGSGKMYESPAREPLPPSAKMEELSIEDADANQAAPGQPRQRKENLSDWLPSNAEHRRPQSFALASQEAADEAATGQVREQVTPGAAQARPEQVNQVHIIKKEKIVFQSGRDEPLRKVKHNQENSTKPKKEEPLEEFEDLQHARSKRRSSMHIDKEQDSKPRIYSTGATDSLAPSAIAKMPGQPQNSQSNRRKESSDSRCIEANKNRNIDEDRQEQRSGWTSKEDHALDTTTRRGLDEMSQSQQSDDLGGCTMQSKSENSSLSGQSSDDQVTSRKDFFNPSAARGNSQKVDEVEARIGVSHFAEADAPFLAKLPTKESLKNREKRCQNLERYQKHMQLNSLFEKFSPMQDFYKGLAPSKNAGKAAAGERTALQARQLAKNSNAGLKPEGPPHLMAGSGLGNHAALGSLESQKGQAGPSGAQATISFYPVSMGSSVRRFKPVAEKQADKNPASKANSLARDLKKPRKQEATGQDKKRNQLIKKTQVEFKSMEAQSQNEADTSNQQVNLDESNARGNFIEGYVDDSQAMQEDTDCNGLDQELGKIDKSTKSKQKIKIIKMRPKKLVINVSMCKYPIIRKIAKYEFNFFLSARDMFAPVNGQIVLDQQASGGTSYVTNGLARDPDDDYFDIYWMDGSGQKHMDRFSQLKSYQRINHFPGMSIICRKNELGKLLNTMLAKYGQKFDFYPRTWVLPRDLRAFEAYVEQSRNNGGNPTQTLQPRGSISSDQLDKEKIFIVKPEAACQGRGIFLARDVKDIENYNQGYQSANGEGQRGAAGQASSAYEHFHCVVQEYIDSPLLIDRMKFDLRLYVLVLGVDPLRLFLFKDGLARLATSAYSKPTEYNMCNMQMHLTNYAINKNSMGFMKNYTALADFVGSKRSLKFVLRYLKRNFNADTSKLMSEIKDLIIKTILSAQPHLSHLYRSYQLDDYENSMCFEILGFDIMLDDKFKPYLLEVNHAPSFATDSPLDEKIKGQVIYDTLNLLGLSQKRKRNYKISNKMRMDLRRMSTRKANLPVVLREQLRKDFDELRNQYEFRNKGMYDMIYPILDEITLDPVEDRMRPYLVIQEWATREYCKKNHIKAPVPLEKLKKQETQQNQDQKQRGPAGTAGWGKGGSQGFGSAGYHPTEVSQKLRQNYKNVKSRVFDDVNGKNKNKSNQPLVEEQVNQSPFDKQEHKLHQLTQFLLSGAQDQALSSSQLQERLRIIKHQILPVPATMNHLNELLQYDQQLKEHCGGGPTVSTQYSQQIQKSKDELRQLIIKLSEDLQASSNGPAQRRASGARPATAQGRVLAQTRLAREQKVSRDSVEAMVAQPGEHGRRNEAIGASNMTATSMNQPATRKGNYLVPNAQPSALTASDNAAESFERVLNSELAGLTQSRMVLGGRECLTFSANTRAGAAVSTLDRKSRTFLVEPKPSATSVKPSAISGAGVPPASHQNVPRENGGVPILIKSIHLAPSHVRNHSRSRDAPQRTNLAGRPAGHTLQAQATAKEQIAIPPSEDQIFPSHSAMSRVKAAQGPQASITTSAEQPWRAAGRSAKTVSRMQKMQSLQDHTEHERRDPNSASVSESRAGLMKGIAHSANLSKDIRRDSPGAGPEWQIPKEREAEDSHSFGVAPSSDQSKAKMGSASQMNSNAATRSCLERPRGNMDNKMKALLSENKLLPIEFGVAGMPPSQHHRQDTQIYKAQMQPKRVPQGRRQSASGQAKRAIVEVSFDEVGARQGERGTAAVLLLENQPQHPPQQQSTGRPPLKLKLAQDPHAVSKPSEAGIAGGQIAGGNPARAEARAAASALALQQASPAKAWPALRAVQKRSIAGGPAAYLVSQPTLVQRQPQSSMLPPAPPVYRVPNAPEAAANAQAKTSGADPGRAQNQKPVPVGKSSALGQRSSYSQLLAQQRSHEVAGAAFQIQRQPMPTRTAGGIAGPQEPNGKDTSTPCAVLSQGSQAGAHPQALTGGTFLQVQQTPGTAAPLKIKAVLQAQPPQTSNGPRQLPQRTINIASGLSVPAQAPRLPQPVPSTSPIAKQLSAGAIRPRAPVSQAQSAHKPLGASSSKYKGRARRSLGGHSSNEPSHPASIVPSSAGAKQLPKSYKKAKDGGRTRSPSKTVDHEPAKRAPGIHAQLRRQLRKEFILLSKQ